MRSAPQDLPLDRLVGELAAGWGIHPASLDYVPEGGGSHHWRSIEDGGVGHFVTVDDLADKNWLGDDPDIVFDGLRLALETATALRDEADLHFVVAPLVAHNGRAVLRVADKYAVSVFPLYASRSFPFGPYTDSTLRDAAIDMVVDVHLATPTVRDRAPFHVLRYGGQEDLAALAVDRKRPWQGGPFSERARLALIEHLAEIFALVKGFDDLADRTWRVRQETVITHGEPHPANLLLVDGRALLVDWDTAALAPPERDLALICSGPDEGAARYEFRTGHPVNFDIVVLYQLRWYLDDLATAARMFRRPHLENPDTERWWEGLVPRLGQLQSWLGRLG